MPQCRQESGPAHLPELGLADFHIVAARLDQTLTTRDECVRSGFNLFVGNRCRFLSQQGSGGNHGSQGKDYGQQAHPE